MTRTWAPMKRIFELEVVLKDVEPKVWRRLLVPAAISLPKLHDLLQLAMGWTNSHLHSFTVNGCTYSMTGIDDFDELDMVPEERQTLQKLLGTDGGEFSYLYDFGDSWVCRIKAESRAEVNLEWDYPVCIAGGRATPPDDVGGVGGYEDFLAAIQDPSHEDHDSMLTWIGGAFDPEGFDLNAVNRVLRLGRR